MAYFIFKIDAPFKNPVNHYINIDQRPEIRREKSVVEGLISYNWDGFT